MVKLSQSSKHAGERVKWDELKDQQCSMARALSAVGDRWTLLILSDCFLGVRRFDQFRARLGISRTLLTDRLNLLEEEGVLSRRAYQDKPVRHEYRLTSKGRDLYPVIMGLVHWGDSYYADAAGPPILHRHKSCGHDFRPRLTCSECGESVSAVETEARRRDDLPGFPPVERGPVQLP